jgi:protein-disulfide isomerase
VTETEVERRRRLYQVGALAVTAGVVIAVVAGIATSGSPTKLAPGKPVPGAPQTLGLFAGIPQNGVTLGDPHAPVTLVEFGDLQCPFCAQFAQDALPVVVAHYVRAGRVVLVFRNLALIGSDSLKAARMAAAVGEQNRLWQFIDLAYKNQETGENTGYVTNDYLKAIAGAIPGVDVSRAIADSAGSAAQAQIDQAHALAQRFAIGSTPSFLIGRTGQPLHRLTPYDLGAGSFSGPLDRVLAKGSA